VLADYPNLAIVATSCARHRARQSTIGAACASRRERSVVGPTVQGLEIFDRVGGGDSFASGLIYGLLEENDAETALAYGVAHGALAMTTPGDTSMVTLVEVEHVMRAGAARIVR
jgi:2-dehydro-3-deoxygluconokinase